jgi:inosine-uridine nucleoside N-ribohydrolase
MNSYLRLNLFFLFLTCFGLCGSSAIAQKNVPNIIFETDMGNDVDDALALDMIYKYLDRGQVNLLAVNSNKQSKYSTEYIHLMNYWYGYPKIPIGKVIYGADSENDAKKYAEHVCLMKNEQGRPLFSRPKFNYDAIPDAVKLYRRILAKQPDTSVTIISVGFSTNIARLLQTEPDSYSSLSGKELVAKKVKLLSVMAGSFGEIKPVREYNIVKDIPAAKLVAEQWPTPIVYAPFEIGIEVQYPGKSIENDFKWAPHHPVVEAYKYYLPMPYDRPTWDLLALLYVMENSPKYFGMSPWGMVKIDEKGSSSFTPDPYGRRAYLTVSKDQAKTILNRFIEVITTKPAKLK